MSHLKRMLSVLAVTVAVLLTSCSNSGNATVFLLPHSPFSSATAVANMGEVTEEVRGVWIASVYNINFPTSPDLTAEELKDELDSIVQTVISHNMNTVYFQVHPASDALYRSDLFPVSKYLYSDGILHFDPLDYMTKICRENGISLFAWINPLRVSVAVADSADEARNALPAGSPGKDEKLTVFFGDGKLYLNCGVPAVRDLVADTVDEIMSGYDVDGIVFDDYFYPYPATDSAGNACAFDDSAEYAASGTSMTLEDWRRDNVNQMIKLCYDRVKSHDADKKFGVAPFGIWQNDDGANGGSVTSGLEAYSELFCDAASWIKGRYVDFISPQLYWECNSGTAPFGELANFWNRLTDGSDVELIISHGIYRYDNDWEEPKGEFYRQVEISRELISYKGSMLYGYATLLENVSGAADDTLAAFKDEVYYYDPGAYPEEISVSVQNGADIDHMQITFSGYSDPNKPLTVNGTRIDRGHGGYFECELGLSYGENEFIFVCGDATKTVTIIKNDITGSDN